MLTQHSALKLIDYSIVNFTPFDDIIDCTSCVVLSYKLDGTVYSHYTPINLKTQELIYIDILENNHKEPFISDSRLVVPEELIESRGITSAELITMYSSLEIQPNTQAISYILLHDYLFGQTKELWQEYVNKTLQIRIDLHDSMDFALFGEIENYRIRNNLGTTAAAMKALLGDALTLQRLNIVIENDKLFKKDYL